MELRTRGFQNQRETDEVPPPPDRPVVQEVIKVFSLIDLFLLALKPRPLYPVSLCPMLKPHFYLPKEVYLCLEVAKR